MCLVCLVQVTGGVYGMECRERGLRRNHFDQDARSRLVSVINIAIYNILAHVFLVVFSLK